MLRRTSSAVRQLGGAARNAALVATAILALVGLLAGAVRVLPWLLDPAVPWRVAQPFARGLAAVSLEAALLVGWPIGWALACFRFVERGEARVLQTLGQPPLETVARLMPGGAPLALALAGVALVYGSDASAPGRVVTDLIGQARASCEAARAPVTYSIPFTDLTWLCAPDREPRVVGSGPGQMATRHAERPGGPGRRRLPRARPRRCPRPAPFHPAGARERRVALDARHGPVGARVDALRAGPGARARPDGVALGVRGGVRRS